MTYDEKLRLIKELTQYKTKFTESKDFAEFIVDCKLFLNPQSYGSKIERRWIKDRGYKKVKSTLNRGDYKDGNKWVEFKVSFESQGKWFLLQIRPYQKIDRYDILLIDKDMKPTIYKISKDKMKELVDKFGDVCHGTKMSNQDNINLEYRITLTNDIIQNHIQ
jgi:hypothetical protein